jgi:hypothetical protein
VFRFGSEEMPVGDQDLAGPQEVPVRGGTRSNCV